jgi:hypothetical protein
MSGNCGVAAQLVASEEGLSSMELVMRKWAQTGLHYNLGNQW